MSAGIAHSSSPACTGHGAPLLAVLAVLALLLVPVGVQGTAAAVYILKQHRKQNRVSHHRTETREQCRR